MTGKLLLIILTLALLAVALALSQATTAAQSGDGYDLTWSTVEGGGASTGGGYSLTGAAGQPDSGALSGGSYALVGGFWEEIGAAGQQVYLPVVLKP